MKNLDTIKKKMIRKESQDRITKALVTELMNKRNLTAPEAYETLAETSTYQHLIDNKSELFGETNELMLYLLNTELSGNYAEYLALLTSR